MLHHGPLTASCNPIPTKPTAVTASPLLPPRTDCLIAASQAVLAEAAQLFSTVDSLRDLLCGCNPRPDFPSAGDTPQDAIEAARIYISTSYAYIAELQAAVGGSR